MSQASSAVPGARAALAAPAGLAALAGPVALAAAERKRKRDELIAFVTAIVGMFLIGGISFAVIVAVLWLITR